MCLAGAPKTSTQFFKEAVVVLRFQQSFEYPQESHQDGHLEEHSSNFCFVDSPVKGKRVDELASIRRVLLLFETLSKLKTKVGPHHFEHFFLGKRRILGHEAACYFLQASNIALKINYRRNGLHRGFENFRYHEAIHYLQLRKNHSVVARARDVGENKILKKRATLRTVFPSWTRRHIGLWVILPSVN